MEDWVEVKRGYFIFVASLLLCFLGVSWCEREEKVAAWLGNGLGVAGGGSVCGGRAAVRIMLLGAFIRWLGDG